MLYIYHSLHILFIYSSLFIYYFSMSIYNDFYLCFIVFDHVHACGRLALILSES